MSSLKERLQARERPSVPYELRVASVAETERAEAALLTARKALRGLELRDEPDKQALSKAKRDLKRAQEARDACYETITVRALPPEDFEALADLHPEADTEDPKEQRRADEAYLYAVLAAATAETGMSEEDWREVTPSLSTGERNDLLMLAKNVNGYVRRPSGDIPKG